jgi:hypothetical protein
VFASVRFGVYVVCYSQADIRFADQYILFGVYDVLDVVQCIRLGVRSVRFGVESSTKRQADIVVAQADALDAEA